MFNWSLKKEKREYWEKAIFKEIMAEKFPKLMRDIKPQIQEAQQTQAG